MKAMPKPLFVNVRRLIISALGLMQLCQCQANTRKMVKTVQMRVATDNREGGGIGNAYTRIQYSARHGHVTLSKFLNRTISLNQQRLRLLPSRRTRCMSG